MRRRYTWSVASRPMKRFRGLADRIRRGAPAEPSAALPELPPPTWADDAPSPWGRGAWGRFGPTSTHACPICRWTGEQFGGVVHSESALCPGCGSISRDRFLFWCFVNRTPEHVGARVLETSPRMDGTYRAAMGKWFDYTCSDYDESAHRGTVRLDLQAIDRPDASFDIVLTPHVLEHVPDTDTALDELYRIMAPGGRVYLQVPVLQGSTAPPTSPEFHGDNTPVFWRFGFDLTERLREHGFVTELLCTDEWIAAVDEGWTEWPTATSPEFDVASILGGVRRDDLVAVADDATAHRFGFRPAYMYLTWECVKPAR